MLRRETNWESWAIYATYTESATIVEQGDESHDEEDDEINHSIFKINKCLHKEHEAYYKIVVAFSIINGDPSKTLDEPCPICYEQIYSNIQQYATCSQCKKSIHRVNCLQKLKTPKCPCCRAIDVFVINYPNVVF